MVQASDEQPNAVVWELRGAEHRAWGPKVLCHAACPRKPMRHLPQVYTEPLGRRHYASWFSLAVLFRVGLFLINVGVSLVVAYSTGGFWVKLRPTVAQPTVHYTGDALLLFEVGSTWLLGWCIGDWGACSMCMWVWV